MECSNSWTAPKILEPTVTNRISPNPPTEASPSADALRVLTNVTGVQPCR